MIEGGVPAPFEVGIDSFRIGAVVVAEKLEANRNLRLPHKLCIITWPTGETGTDVEQRMGERRLIAANVVVESGKRLPPECESQPVVERPAAEGQQGSGGVVRRENRRSRAQLVLSEAGRERALDRHGADFLADPAVDRRRGDRILDVPVGAFVLKADRREHQARAGRECNLASAHRSEAEVSLAEARFDAVASLERADDRCRQRPGELRLPDEIDVAQLRPDPEIVATPARAQLAKTAVDPALLAVDRHEADVADELEGVGREQFQGGFGVRRRRP